MTSADLYLESIDFKRYMQFIDCSDCGLQSCVDFISAVKKGIIKTQNCPFIDRNIAYALESVKKIEGAWPDVPLLTHPRPSYAGVVELHNPTPESLVLITGNNEYTEQVLMTVLGTTICPFFVIFVDTDGNTVDMSMIYGTLTAERINAALKNSGISEKVVIKKLIIPGLASFLQAKLTQLSGWNVILGPVCAAELPLFLSEIWIPPDTI